MPKGIRPNGLRIAKARLALPEQPTQAEFASRVGIHWVTQSNIENGKANVSLELLERIAEATQTTREQLLLSEEDEEAAQVPTPEDVMDIGVAIGEMFAKAVAPYVDAKVALAVEKALKESAAA